MNLRVFFAGAALLSTAAFAQTFDFAFYGEFDVVTRHYKIYITNTSTNAGNLQTAIYKIGLGTNGDGEGATGQLGGQLVPMNFLPPPDNDANAVFSIITANGRVPNVAGKNAYSYFNGPGNEWWHYDTQVYNGTDGSVQSSDLGLVGDTMVLDLRERYNTGLDTMFPALFHVAVTFGCDNDTANNVFYPYRVVEKQFDRSQVWRVVPEPGTIAALGAGMLVLLARRRRV